MRNRHVPQQAYSNAVLAGLVLLLPATAFAQPGRERCELYAANWRLPTGGSWDIDIATGAASHQRNDPSVVIGSSDRGLHAIDPLTGAGTGAAGADSGAQRAATIRYSVRFSRSPGPR